MNILSKPADWAGRSLSQKIQWAMKEWPPGASRYVDKLEAKKIANSLCGNEIEIPRVVRVLKNPQDLQQTDLIPGLVLKSNHACNTTVDLGKSQDILEIRCTLKRRAFPYWKATGEMQYKDIPITFYTEEKVADYKYGVTGEAGTFYFMVLGGHVEAMTLEDRVAKKKAHYRVLGRSTGGSTVLERDPVRDLDYTGFQMPEETVLEKMMRIAENLAAGWEFLRVDLYLGAGGIIWFSEFTLTPNMGKPIFTPAVDAALGRLWP